MHSHITAVETLRAAAALQLKMPAEKREERVQLLLDSFDLRKTENTPVGGEGKKGLSGGEKKRLSISVVNGWELFTRMPTSTKMFQSRREQPTTRRPTASLLP